MVTYFYWSIAFRIGRGGNIEIRFLTGIDRVEILFDGMVGRCALFCCHDFRFGGSVEFGQRATDDFRLGSFR